MYTKYETLPELVERVARGRACTAVEAAHLIAALRELYRDLPTRARDAVRTELRQRAAESQQ